MITLVKIGFSTHFQNLKCISQWGSVNQDIMGHRAQGQGHIIQGQMMKNGDNLPVNDSLLKMSTYSSS